MTSESEAVSRNHDGLTKWLIRLFYKDFFAYFYNITDPGEVTFLDKELITKYPGLKDSLEADMFLSMMLTIDGERRPAVVVIEHKDKKKDAREQLFEYFCYGWLLWKKPIWAIAVYTDKARSWRVDVPRDLVVGYTHEHGPITFSHDTIKVSHSKSADLIAEGSLFCCLLALRADDRNLKDRAELIRAIFRAAKAMGPRLTRDHKLLIAQYLLAYGKVTKRTVEEIEEEQDMGYPAETVTEYFENIEKRAERHGKIKGALEKLEELRDRGILTEEMFEAESAPLRRELERLQD
ncbi:MAG: hypothetical protein QNK37_08155 [Acidobacteriota bacterium]|nr:hypothetical protein [Acidobacteriota bacterium]